MSALYNTFQANVNALFRNCDGTRAFRVGFFLFCSQRYRLISPCIFRTSFQPKRLDTTSQFPFNCHQEVLALLFIYLFIIINDFKKEIIAHLKWEPSATSSLPHKIFKNLKQTMLVEIYLADESEPSPRFLIKKERRPQFFIALISLCRIFFIWVHSAERSLASSA